MASSNKKNMICNKQNSSVLLISGTPRNALSWLLLTLFNLSRFTADAFPDGRHAL